jgi:hypothetical protein
MKSLASRLGVAAFASLGFSLAVGCSGAGNATTGDDQNATPAAKSNLFDQADVCTKVLKANGLARDTDSHDGNIRWSCADVPGVNAFKRLPNGQIDKTKLADPRDGFGQEYCEYNAVAKGKIVIKPSDVSGVPLQCVFTSVHADATPNTDLGAMMTSSANLGVQTDPRALKMQVGFNSRGAADALIRDCHTASTSSSVASDLSNEARTAACFLASVAATDPAKRDALIKACRGRLQSEDVGGAEPPSVDLSSDSRFKAAADLGVKLAQPGDPGFEHERDLAACLGTARGRGVTWRNSDNMICGRVIREAQECGCSWGPIPTAFQGFQIGGWTNDTKIPDGCRYAKGPNGDYVNIVICDVQDQEVQDFVSAGGTNLQTLCHDAFAKDIVLRAPLRVALEQKGTCKGTNSVCANVPVSSGGTSGGAGSGGEKGQ